MNNHLKTIAKSKDELRVGNYLALFGGKDLQGETFTSKTDFESSYTRTGTLHVDWEHGMLPDEIGRDSVLGIVDWKTAYKDKFGLFVERVLNRRNEYMRYIEELIREGLLGTSSEATLGKVVKSGIITKWPLKRDALTVMPAEFRMMREYGGNTLQAIKSLSGKMPALKSLLLSETTSGFAPFVWCDALSDALQACVKGGCELRWKNNVIRSSGNPAKGRFYLDGGSPVIEMSNSLSREEIWPIFLHEMVHARQRRDLWGKSTTHAEITKLEDVTNARAAEMTLRVRDACLYSGKNYNDMYVRSYVLGELYRWG